MVCSRRAWCPGAVPVAGATAGCRSTAPGAWTRARGRASLPHDPVTRSHNDLAAQLVGCLGREDNRVEPFLCQDLLPALRGQARTARQAQLSILIQPPPFQEAEGQVGEESMARYFIE